MTNNPVNVIIMILLASFVIDRIATASLFVLSFSGAWTGRFPDPSMVEESRERRLAARNQKLIYFVLAGTLALWFLALYKNVGVLGALGFQASEIAAIAQPSPGQSPVPGQRPTTTPTPTPTPMTAIPQVGAGLPEKPPRSWGDALLTWLILVGGAENIAKLLKGYGHTGRNTESQPIEITGKLTLEERQEKGDKG